MRLAFLFQGGLPMILLFTDYGGSDIYVGQLKVALLGRAPDARIIDLLHEVPNFDARLGAHLLAALSRAGEEASITLAVVDAGVGSARRPVVMHADGRWYVGPDNGLLSVVAARARACRLWRIDWRPEHLSSSFHGRDLFAPVAAMLERNEWWPGALTEVERLEVAFDETDLPQVIYIDHYGNAMTGMRAGAVPHSALLAVAGHRLRHARVFSEVSAGTPFWYENSVGLVEIAVNCGSAAKQLGLSPGSPVQSLT